MATRRGPDGTARIAVQGTHRGTNWANVFWVNLSGGATAVQADFDAIVLGVGNQHKSHLGATLVNTVTYVQAKGTLFQTGGAVLQSLQALSGTALNAVAEIDDNSACYVVSWNSSVYWRGGKPRTYLPGVQQASVSDGHTIAAGDATALQTNANAFRTAVNGLSSGGITATNLGFVSFVAGKVDRVPPVFFNVSGSTVHHRLGSQRRRLGKWVL